MARGRPRKSAGSLAADTDKPISLYLPLVQSAWLELRGRGETLRRLIQEADGPPAQPGSIAGASGKDAARLPPAVLRRLDDLVMAARAHGDKGASRASVVRALVFAAMGANAG